MTPELTKRLARLYNLPTLYECVAVNGPRTVLLFYGDSKSKAGFVRWTRRDNPKYAQRLVDLTDSKLIDWVKPFRGTVGTMGEWTIKFSGRTQRDAYVEGEHPFLMDV